MASVVEESLGSTFRGDTLPSAPSARIFDSCVCESPSSTIVTTSTSAQSPNSAPPSAQLAWYGLDMLRMDCTAVTSSDVPPVDPLSSEADEQPISAAARVSA